MDLPGLFLTAFIVGFSGAMMPGPMLTVSINETLRRGAKAGPLIVLGHAILELALVIGLVMGLSLIIRNNLVTAIIGIAGGGFLLWMGADMLKNSYSGAATLNLDGNGEDKGLGPVTSGVLTSLLNPYWSLWWATIGLGYLTMAGKFGFWGVASFFIGHILADFTWYGAVSVAVAKGKNFMSQKVYRGIIAVCGAFLLFLAFSFIKDGVTKLV